MIDVRKQIHYWQNEAEEELLNARIMIENKRILAGLFFCHLCIEKIFKALVVKVTEEHPPRTHNLFLLAEKALIFLDGEQDKFASELQVYQLEGRYPETMPSEPKDMKLVEEYYKNTENLHLWLKAKL